ncbi:MAG: chemotaxis protein CheA [Spirochaetaceae bacterium]|nr:chemotaxis protein CheA [Spirochaetaceae bacterium]
MIDKFKAAFREESFELLSQLEDTLLELESQPRNGELINAAFRAMHTVKGSSAMFGFETISKFTHEIETVLDHCRNGTLPITKDFIGLTLKARDHLRRLLEFDEPPPQELAHDGDALLVRYRDYAASGAGLKPPAQAGAETAAGAAPAAPVAAPQGQGHADAGPATYRVFWKPKPGIFRDGTKVLSLVDELASLGDGHLYPHTECLPPLESLDPESCYCYWDAVLTTAKSENDIRDVFIFVEDNSELKIERLEEPPLDDEGRSKRLGEILIERGLVTRDSLREALGSQKKLGEVLVEKKIVTKPEIESALVEQDHLKKVQEKSELGQGSIRVASDKLDALVDLVGELVTLQARLSQTSFEIKDGPLASISEQFERLIAQLRDNTMSIRMLPIGSTFNKFRRVVRDLSLELGKEAELLTEGAETELDKTVIEKLGDPLVHIIRNSLDHGIERPDARQSAGKDRKGNITLAARHSGAYVLIQVTDDGKGLDKEAIYSKAVERGIIAPGQEMSDGDLYLLIFAPGFSTAKVVSSVSGRGVGMDVVKREIDSLGGSVSLSTEPGRGTTVTLKIPLTLAIIEGLLVRIEDEHYVIPLSSVDGCIEIKREELAAYGDRRILSYREELVPFVSLRGAFETPGAEPEIEQIVIANSQDMRVGFVVDQVVGDYQTVIKPLGRMFKDVEGVSGATILGDGTVALILDVNRLAAAVQRDGLRRSAKGVER